MQWLRPSLSASTVTLLLLALLAGVAAPGGAAAGDSGSTPGSAPWVWGPHEWHGFLGCAQGFNYNYQCGGLDANHRSKFLHETEEGLRTLVLRMEWHGGTGLGLHPDELRLTVETFGAGEPQVLFDGSDGSPIELRFDFGEHDESGFDVKYLVRAPPNTLVYQRPVKICYALFYGMDAPHGYSPCAE